MAHGHGGIHGCRDEKADLDWWKRDGQFNEEIKSYERAQARAELHRRAESSRGLVQTFDSIHEQCLRKSGNRGSIARDTLFAEFPDSAWWACSTGPAPRKGNSNCGSFRSFGDESTHISSHECSEVSLSLIQRESDISSKVSLRQWEPFETGKAQVQGAGGSSRRTDRNRESLMRERLALHWDRLSEKSCALYGDTAAIRDDSHAQPGNTGSPRSAGAYELIKGDGSAIIPNCEWNVPQESGKGAGHASGSLVHVRRAPCSAGGAAWRWWPLAAILGWLSILLLLIGFFSEAAHAPPHHGPKFTP